VLGPQVFTEAFDAVVKAVEDGTISQQRIDESVRRILRLKHSIRK
jgi:beta-N-acetylhexosaminidase